MRFSQERRANMEISIFIAQVLGPFYLVAGLGMMLNRGFFKRVIEDFCQNATLMFYSGSAALVYGLFVVLLHNVWVKDWPVIITITGWAAILKGVMLILSPEVMCRFMQVYQRNEKIFTFHSGVALLLGVILTAFGYFVG